MTNMGRNGVVLASVMGLMAMSLSALPTSARAQTNAQANVTATAKSVPAMDVKGMSLGLIADRLSKASGVAVVTDSAMASAPVTFASAGGGLDAVLTQLAAVLPPGATIRAALIPDDGTKPDGDVIAALLRAQDALAPKAAASATTATTGTAGAAKTTLFTPGHFDVLGQQVTREQAAGTITDLHLRPVYAVIQQRPDGNPVAKLAALQTAAMKLWAQLTPDQQKQAMAIQFNSMMSMEPAERAALLGQIMQPNMYFMSMIQSMPDDQRNEMMKEMIGAVANSGAFPASGKGAVIVASPANPL